MNAVQEDADKLRDGLLEWVYQDALLDEDSKLTYAEARQKWGLRTIPTGMGRVLTLVTDQLAERYGPAIARGVAAYVVRAETKAPGDGWRTCVTGVPPVSAEAARSQARAALRELRSS